MVLIQVTADYSTTLDSGIDVSGTMNLTTRDCQGDKTANCNVVNFNFVTFSGGFGSVSVGERSLLGGNAFKNDCDCTNCWADGAVFQNFYSTDGVNVYGSANEQDYANNAMKIYYGSNVYSGFSFAASYTPNTGETGATVSGQATSVTSGKWTILTMYYRFSVNMKWKWMVLVRISLRSTNR